MQPLKAVLEVLCRHDVVVVLDGDLEEDLNLLRAGGAPTRPRPRARAVRPARGNPWGRPGRLHAPEAARTGPVSALRRYSSWSPPGRWLNGHNGHFLGQPTRPWVGTPRGVIQVRWAYPTDFWRTWTTTSPAAPASPGAHYCGRAMARAA